MKIGYAILAHHNPGQLRRLIRSLATRDSAFFVHVDRKSDLSAFQAAAGDLSAVHIISKEKIHWGGWSTIRASLALLESAVDHRRDRVFLMSGADYPIRGNRDIHEYFDNDRVYMDHCSIPNEWPDASERYERHHFVDPSTRLNAGWAGLLSKQVLARMKKRRLPGSLHPFGGSAWWSMSRDAAQYVLAYVRANPRVVRFFETTLCADEMFYQTILLNSSQWRDKVVNDNHYWIRWTEGSRHPHLVGKTDFDELVESKRFFARKFDINSNPGILDLLDRHRRVDPTRPGLTRGRRSSGSK